MKRIIFLLVLIALAGNVSAQMFSKVTTYCGNGQKGYFDGDTVTARLNEPFGIYVAPNGNLYICDHENSVIRLIEPNGTVSTFAGDGNKGFKNGHRDTASFNQPTGITGDGNGNFYVADFLNQRIRKIDTSGMVTTYAGIGTAGYADGPDSVAYFNYPRGIDLDAQGNLYVGDSWNHRIRKIDIQGNVSTYAGGGSSMGVQSPGDYVDGPDTSARFWTPTEVKVDAMGNVFVADPFTHRIRKIDTNRVVSTVAGSSTPGQSTGGFANGHVSTAQFNTPTTLFVDEFGQIFVGDGPNHRVRMIGLDDTVRTIAGSGTPGMFDGTPLFASFRFPRGIEKSADGRRLFIVDFNNHAIRSLWFSPPVGIKEEMGAGLSFYPNPAQEKVLVELNGQVNEVKLISLAGKELMQIEVRGRKDVVLDLEELSAGLYFVELNGEKGRSIKKLLKN